MVAIFSCGLKRGARIWQKISGVGDVDYKLNVAAYDCLKMLVWLNSSDGQEGVNRPKSLYNTLFGNPEKQTGDAAEFETPEDFRREWERINNGNNS